MLAKLIDCKHEVEVLFESVGGEGTRDGGTAMTPESTDSTSAGGERARPLKRLIF